MICTTSGKPDESSSTTLKTKPLKRRGLSKFYSSKSQSFSSIDLALGQLRSTFGDSSQALGKARNGSDLTDASLVSEVVSSEPSGECETPSCSYADTAGTTWSSSSALTDEMCNDFLMALHISRSAPSSKMTFARVSRASTFNYQHSISQHLHSALVRSKVSQISGGFHCTSMSSRGSCHLPDTMESVQTGSWSYGSFKLDYR